jgi:hypothetical protein
MDVIDFIEKNSCDWFFGAEDLMLEASPEVA